MCSQSQWRVNVRPYCVQSVSVACQCKALLCAVSLIPVTQLSVPLSSAQHAHYFPQFRAVRKTHPDRQHSSLLCPPRHLCSHSRLCRYVPLPVSLSLTVRLTSLARFTYGYCTLHKLYPDFLVLWSWYPLFNKNQAVCYFLSPEPEVTCCTATFIIRVVLLSPYLRIRGVSVFSNHYNQSHRVYMSRIQKGFNVCHPRCACN